MSEKPPTPSVIEAVLCELIDPELGISFPDLGLIYDITVSEHGHVHILYTLTTPGCPIAGEVEGLIAALIEPVAGVTLVSSELTWLPLWSPAEMMSDDAKFAFGF
jgi:metal-sulfur cluster biosynthetic enzyme